MAEEIVRRLISAPLISFESSISFYSSSPSIEGSQHLAAFFTHPKVCGKKPFTLAGLRGNFSRQRDQVDRARGKKKMERESDLLSVSVLLFFHRGLPRTSLLAWRLFFLINCSRDYTLRGVRFIFWEHPVFFLGNQSCCVSGLSSFVDGVLPVLFTSLRFFLLSLLGWKLIASCLSSRVAQKSKFFTFLWRRSFYL